ncbi:MAG: glycosyltransferase [Caldilinea sp. CFX5]|nr:glycosyltransferase [Caldilinea sp. CFX5]
MRILFLSRWFPYPINNGSKLRVYHLLAGLAAHHDVTLLSFADEAGNDVAPPELGALCTSAQVVPWQPFVPDSWRARLSFFMVTPRSIVNTYSPQMARAIAQTVAQQPYDLIIASQLATAGYVRHFGQTPALFEEVELGVLVEPYRQATTLRSRFRHGLTWFKHRRYVDQVLRRFRGCTVVSTCERQLVSATVPGYKPIEVFPNCVNLADYAAVQRQPTPNALIFTGSFRYFANYEAMVWFLREVFPQVQAQNPDVTLTITGDHANQPLPSAQNVQLTGFVPDIRPLIAEAWCSIAPIHRGGGTRVKILEAMALGTPVVTTSKGAEGIDAQDGVHLLIADTPQAFTEAILRLFREAGLRERLTTQAYQLVRTKYDWAATLPRFLHMIERTIKSSPTERRRSPFVN